MKKAAALSMLVVVVQLVDLWLQEGKRPDRELNADAITVGFARITPINLGGIAVVKPQGTFVTNPRCDKDLDSFLSARVQTGRRKPPVRKTSLNT